MLLGKATAEQALKMRNKSAISITLFLGIATCVHADQMFHNANKISDYNENKDAYRGYLNGVMNGFFWANAFSSSLNNVKSFCLPENISTSDIDYIGILNRHLEKSTALDKEKYIEASLMIALKEKFPCKN